MNKNYFFVFQSVWYSEINITFVLCSSETSTTISKIISSDIFITKNKLNYIFKINRNHKKYILFGFKKLKAEFFGELKIYEENNNYNNIKYEKNISEYFENYVELQKDSSYLIYLTLTGTSLYLYFAQSDYSKIIPAEINTEYFKEFPVLKEVNILLDMSSIKKGNQMMVLTSEWYDKEDSLSAYGYDNNNMNILQSNSGDQLDIFVDSHYKYKYFIIKDSNDIKYSIFKVKAPSDGKLYYINIRYGYQEKYIPSTPFLTFGIGLALSIPNLIIEILNLITIKKNILIVYHFQ